MIVVSDTSCISNLVTLQADHLLPELFGRVLVPPAVFAELQRFHDRLPAFLVVQGPSAPDQVARFRLEVDHGEAEAIALALEVGADRLLIDESLGRSVARREGLRIVGVLGILLAAKQRTLIPAIRPMMDRLQSEAGFYIAPALRHDLLKAAK